MLRFVTLLVVFVVLFTVLIRRPWVDRHVILPYTEAIAALSASMIRVFVPSATAQSTAILCPRFSVDIRRGCDGIEGALLLVSVCLAYRMSWRSRVAASILGFLLIFATNLARIVALYLIGLNASRPVFNFFHVYVFQFAVVGAAMVFWIYWIGRQQSSSP